MSVQQLLGLKAVQDAPITRAVVDLEQVRDQDVLRVVVFLGSGPRRVPVVQRGAPRTRGRTADVVPGQTAVS